MPKTNAPTKTARNSKLTDEEDMATGKQNSASKLSGEVEDSSCRDTKKIKFEILSKKVEYLRRKNLKSTKSTGAETRMLKHKLREAESSAKTNSLPEMSFKRTILTPKYKIPRRATSEKTATEQSASTLAIPSTNVASKLKDSESASKAVSLTQDKRPKESKNLGHPRRESTDTTVVPAVSSASTATSNKSTRASLVQREENDSAAECEMEWETTEEKVVSRVHEVRKKIELCVEPMDVQLPSQNVTPESSCTSQVALVIDTNIYLSHLSLVTQLLRPPHRGKYQIHIPWTILQELDYMKTNRDSKSKLELLAREAANFIHGKIAERNPLLRVQTTAEFTVCSKIFQAESPDDTILQYCLYVKQNNTARCVLFSNDILLCTKAMSNDIEAYRKENFDELLNSGGWNLKTGPGQPLTPVKYQREETVTETVKMDETFLSKVEDILVIPLSKMLEQEMKAAFDDLWVKIVLVKPPWTLLDICRCVDKHWIAVFSYSYSRNFQDLMAGLRRILQASSRSVLDDVVRKELVDTATKILDTVIFRKEELRVDAERAMTELQDFIHPKKDCPPVGSSAAILEMFNFLWSQFNTACGTVFDAVHFPHTLVYEPLPFVPSVEEVVGYVPQLFAAILKLETTMASFLRDLESDCLATRAFDLALGLRAALREMNLECPSLKDFGDDAGLRDALLSFAHRETNRRLMMNGLQQLQLFCSLMQQCQNRLIHGGV